MFGNKLDIFKSKQGQNEKTSDKKKIENLIVFIIILIITIIAINKIWNGNDKKSNSKDETNSYSKQLATTNNDTSIETFSKSSDLEENLKKILGRIQGVGNVEVFINYSESSESVAMYNENSKKSSTEETDTSGGKRTIEQTDTQKDVIFKEEGGEKVPITQKIIQPKIEGAIITAQGANNAGIKTNIIQAVEAATGLATHKIQVFEMN